MVGEFVSSLLGGMMWWLPEGYTMAHIPLKYGRIDGMCFT